VESPLGQQALPLEVVGRVAVAALEEAVFPQDAKQAVGPEQWGRGEELVAVWAVLERVQPPLEEQQAAGHSEREQSALPQQGPLARQVPREKASRPPEPQLMEILEPLAQEPPVSLPPADALA